MVCRLQRDRFSPATTFRALGRKEFVGSQSVVIDGGLNTLDDLSTFLLLDRHGFTLKPLNLVLYLSERACHVLLRRGVIEVDRSLRWRIACQSVQPFRNASSKSRPSARIAACRPSDHLHAEDIYSTSLTSSLFEEPSQYDARVSPPATQQDAEPIARVPCGRSVLSAALLTTGRGRPMPAETHGPY